MKQSLDDFLLGVKGDAQAKLAAFEALPIHEFSKLKELWKLNTEFAILLSPPCIVNMQNGDLVTRQNFTQIIVANRKTIGAKADGSPTSIAAGVAWIEWPYRRSYTRMVYEPGHPTDMDDGSLNNWKGWGAESIEGDVSRWNQLMTHVFSSDPSSRKWFEQWVAYPIQNPGVKLYQAAVITGPQGAGKSLTGVGIGRIYGENWCEVKPEMLHGSHNIWALNKQFILADEVSSSDRRTDADFLKNLITNKTTEINKKHVSQFTIRDCSQYMFTSNHADALFLADDDRRYFVHHIPTVLDPAEAAKIGAWLHTPEGAAALHYYFDHIDLEGFCPTGPAPSTAAKLEMIDAGRSDLDRWAFDVIEDPDGILGAGTDTGTVRDLWKLEDLIGIYEHSHGRVPARKALANALRRAGAVQTSRVRTKSDGRIQLWAVRNLGRWKKATLDELAAGFDKKARKFE